MLDLYTKKDLLIKRIIDQELLSMLPLFSKVYERVIYEQESNYFEPLMTFCVDFKKYMVRNMFYLNYQLHGKVR